MENNRMVEYKEGFFDKIKNFFFRLFKKSSDNIEKEPEILTQQSNVEKDIFKNNILIKQDEEELKLLELQKAYKSGKILEENISQEDKEKLIDLYKKQNLELKETITNEKKEIRKILNGLKAS